ncbi:MAG: RnfABCDGE type electron transport complex subunit B [Fibrobacteres bacterium]|nr:RnfABCDGE type electron transport complex subunit B [Fibrobacterota bacterium]
METIFTAIIIVGGVAAISGLAIGIISRAFAVKENPLKAAIEECLPGANCGGCGYPGCAGYAQALADGKTTDTAACSPGGNATLKRIAELLGTDAVEKECEVARLACYGTNDHCGTRYKYDGIKTCAAANLLNGGPKSCPFGCIGFGDCTPVCKFDAIAMDSDGLPHVNEEKCTGCGKCVTACPKKILSLQKISRKVFLRCTSTDTGKEVREYCTVGCIGCGICAKKCPEGALTMKDNIPVWDWSKCTSCGICAEVCPRKIIFYQGKPGKEKNA